VAHVRAGAAEIQDDRRLLSGCPCGAQAGMVLEGLGDLVVQLHAVGHHYEGPVALHPAQHLLGEEHHREALAAALGLPEHAGAAVSPLACLQHRGDGVVDAEELVVLTENLDQPALVLREQREVLHQVEQQIPALFWFNALLIASNGTDSRVGSLTADWERFFEWKRIAREDEPRRVSLEVMLRGTCDRSRLSQLGWTTVSALEETFGASGTLMRTSNTSRVMMRQIGGRPRGLSPAPDREHGGQKTAAGH